MSKRTFFVKIKLSPSSGGFPPSQVEKSDQRCRSGKSHGHKLAFDLDAVVTRITEISNDVLKFIFLLLELCTLLKMISTRFCFILLVMKTRYKRYILRQCKY